MGVREVVQGGNRQVRVKLSIERGAYCESFGKHTLVNLDARAQNIRGCQTWRCRFGAQYETH